MEWIDAKANKPKLQYEDISVNVLVTDGNTFGIGYYDYDLQKWDYQLEGRTPDSDNRITHFAYVELP